VNIPATMRSEIIKTLEKNPLDLTAFDKAAEEIHSVMRKDTFPRFLKSDFLKKEALIS
jgi:hypothetical protein